MMRPGTDTGSAMNALYSRMTKGQPEPVVGMGATILAWTDRYAATIASVEGEPGRWVVGVQEDDMNRKISFAPTYDALRDSEPCDRMPGDTYRRLTVEATTTDGDTLPIGTVYSPGGDGDGTVIFRPDSE